MERKITKKLLEWKNRQKRMPLILYGARQVGKTYSALTFGKEYYKNTAYFSMEDSGEIAAIFERDLNPERIIRELAAKSGQSIFKGETLIVFDEIQACERALTSLKYFCEQAPEYHIIAAGSLLGVSLNRDKYSFPVGKVDMLTLYPLDFEEFLWATDHKALGTMIREAYRQLEPMSLHETAIDYYKTYLVVGGMPRVVKEYVDTRDFHFVYAAQKTLNDAYIADMAKYATPYETTKIMAAWGSIPGQLAKENRKFQYKLIRSGARSYEYETPLDWLKAAGIINKCVKIKEGKMPLSAYAENSSFKVYMLDTGLLCSKLDIAANVVIDNPPSFDGFKGALAENYVMQALVNNGFCPYYWSSAGKAELDFVIQDREGNIIPLETKSANNVKAKSLAAFVTKYEPPYSIRVSSKNFGFENRIKSIPLYAVFCLER
ncbi:archaeal ATPase [Peptococcaceae bacterium CEB3]|nr:archaeal ATPase [Peptococcaceae bacterium CEB3]